MKCVSDESVAVRLQDYVVEEWADMVETFQNGVMRLAMCGLGVSLAAMALRSRPVRVAFARMLAIWRGLTAFGRFAVCSFLLVGILVGGDKINSVNNLRRR